MFCRKIKKGLGYGMKKILVLAAVTCSLLLSACGGAVVLDGTEADGFEIDKPTEAPVETLAPEKREFRGLRWGMSLSDVTKNEGEGYSTVKQGVIRYNNLKMDEYPVEAEYTFEEGKLAMCIYYTTHMHQEPAPYIDDYKDLIKKYEKKYGKYKYSEEKWADGVEKNSSKAAEALDNGTMMFRTGWEQGNTSINLVLFKDTDRKIKIGMRYMPIDINAEGDVAPEGDLGI